MVANGSEEMLSVMVFMVEAVPFSKSVKKALMGSHQRNAHQRMLVHIRR